MNTRVTASKTLKSWRSSMFMSCFYALALGLVAPLAAQTPDQAALETIFLDESLGALDFDAHAAKLLPIIEKDPSSAEAMLALRVLRDNDDKLASHDAILALLARLEPANFKLCGAQAAEFADAYVHYARRADASPKPLEVFKRWRGITAFSVIGPFADYGASAHDDAFAPEVRCDFAAEQRGVYGTVRWKPLSHFDEWEDRLDLDLHARHTACGYYAATVLNAAGECEVLLDIEIGGPGKVWLRGVPLLDLDTRARDFPNIRLRVKLCKGENLLLLKISGNAWFRVRVRDGDGQPFSGKCNTPVTGAHMISGAAPLISRPACQDAGLFERALASLDQLIRDVAEDELDDESRKAVLAKLHVKGAVCALALSEIYRVNRLDTLSSEAMERARGYLPEHPQVALALLSRAANSSHFSGSELNTLRRSELARMMKSEKPSAAVLLEQALLMARDERTSEAIDYCEQACSASPRAWRVLLEMAEIFQQRAWRTEWLAALERARKIAPKAPAVIRAFARYHEYGSEAANALAETTRLAEIWPGDPNLRVSLISQLLRAAKPQKALELASGMVAMRPGDAYALRRQAETFGALGRIEDALKCYDLLQTYTSRPETVLKDAANLLFAHGRDADGKAMLERILKAAPDAHDVRRWLERLNGQSDQFWKPWAMSDTELLKRPIKPEDFPQCGSVVLLDEQVQVIHEDGSSRMYVRQVRKILTQDGVDARGKARPNGEICAARTIKPNGQVLEPVTFRGNNIEFPGLEVGALIDLAYISTEDENPWRNVNSARFYFADQMLAEPFLISRMVVVVPATIVPDIRYHNWPADAVRTEARDGRNIVRTFEVRQAAFKEREAFMPSALEFIPWLEFTQAHDWRIRARELSEEGLQLLRTTRAVSAMAHDLTKGCNTDEAKARAIYAWVNTHLLTEGDSRNAHQAIKARAGDRRQTFAALCFAAGVELGFAYADAPSAYRGGQVEALPTPDWAGPGENDFKTFLFIVNAENAQRIFVSLDARLRPFGALSQRLDGAPAIIVERGAASLITLPGGQFGRDGFRNVTTIELEADGSARVQGAVETHGERSYELKDVVRKQAEEERARELQEQIAEQFAGFESEACTFADLEKPGVPLTRAFKGKVARLAQQAGAKLVLTLPLEKFGPLLSALVNKDKREFDLVLDFDLCQTDELRIRAPAGWQFEKLPHDVLLPCAPLSYSLTFTLEENTLVVRRSLRLGPGRVAVNAYADFVREIRKLSQGEDVTLRLVKEGTPAAKPEEVQPK